MKKIVLTGGGPAGHVTPNIALLPAIRKAGYEITYMGSYDGIEKKLISDFDIPYVGISTGKFRRYLDLKNFLASEKPLITRKGSVKFFGSKYRRNLPVEIPTYGISKSLISFFSIPS